MFQEQWLSLGVSFVLFGLVMVLLVWALLRLAPRVRQSLQKSFGLRQPDSISLHKDAVLVVQRGGRIGYLNPVLREWFDLTDDELPSLERIARSIRPGEEFLDLCIVEGQARLSVNGRLADAVSYRLPASDEIMVTFRRSDFVPALSGSDELVSSSVIKVVTDFGQIIASNLGLIPTVRAVLETVERLVPSDMLELKVWNEADQCLDPYRFASVQDVERSVEKTTYSQFGEYADWVIERRRSLRVVDTKKFTEAQLVAEGEVTSIRSYLGMPLQSGGELVGVLELGMSSADGFAIEDQDILQLIVGQAAVAIRNALLYQEEQVRATELAGLAQLSQSVVSLQNPEDLISRLVESVQALFPVEIVGVLRYHEERHLLEAQQPFFGIAAQVVPLYKVEIKPGTESEEIMLAQQVVITQDAMTDERWERYGLHVVAQAASIHDTALIPLVSGGRSLGFLQLSNHKQSAAVFSENELRLANIVANQIAAIIDNATLLQASRQRAQRSEALRQIATLAGSTATMDEVLRYAVHELSRLLQADTAAVFLLDEENGVMKLHHDSLWGVEPKIAKALTRLYVNHPDFHNTVTGSRRPYLSGSISTQAQMPESYRSVVQATGVESAIVVPLVSRERGIGEMMVGSRKTDFFTKYDLQILITAAAQLAAVVDETEILSQTDENLRKRVEQLTSLARASRELNTSMDTRYRLKVVYDESLRNTGADCGTILLFNGNGNTAQTELHNLAVSQFLGDPPSSQELHPLELQALKNYQPVVVDDFETTEIIPAHEGMRSALVVPIAFDQQPIGLIHLHAKAANQFDNSAIDIIQTLAVQAALVLSNARRFEDQTRQNEIFKRRDVAIEKLLQTSQKLDFDQSLDVSLRNIAEAIQETTPFDAILISVYEPDSGSFRRVTGVGLSSVALEELKARKQPYHSMQPLLQPQFQLGSAYYIPYDRAPVFPADVHMVTVLQDAENSPDRWHSEDLLLVLLKDTQGQPLGLISFDAPRDGLRPDLAAIHTLEIFASQAALVISGGHRLRQQQEKLTASTQTIERQQRLLSVGQINLPTLLRKDLEQTIAIHNLDRRTQRIRAGLQITESIGRQLDASSALQALGREILTQLGMAVALIAEETPEGARLTNVLGSIPRATSPEALFGQRNPLRSCLQTGEMMLVMNLDEHDEWREAPLLTSLRAKSFICLPVIVEGKSVAAVLALSPEPLPALTDEDRQVYYQIMRQASVILQNISLLSETRRRLQEVNLLLDFSRQLSGLNPDSIVAALLKSARRVLAQTAHAGLVLLWDSTRQTLIPRSISGYADVDSMNRITYAKGEALPGKVFNSGQPLRVDEIIFARDYSLPAEKLLNYRQATAGRLPVSTLIVPIQAGDRNLGVLLLDNFNTTAAFTSEDQNLLLSLCQQVALGLENVRLVQSSQERARQLEALNEVATTLTISLRSDQLIVSLLDHLRTVVDYTTATLWLREGNKLKVSMARGFEDDNQRIGLTVDMEDSRLFDAMIKTGLGIVVPDVREDARFLALTESERLSWMGVPLISKGAVVGALALEKIEVNAYSNDILQIATTFASQAAIALENARLFEDSAQRATELDRRSQRLALLNRFSAALSGSLNANQVLSLTADELLRALNASKVSVVTFESAGPYLSDEIPFDNTDLPRPIQDVPLFAYLKESLGVFTSDDVLAEPELAPLADLLGDQTRSLMILPLTSGVDLQSLVFVHMDNPYRFSPSEIELAITIGNQAAIALENARLYQSTLMTAERLAIVNQVTSEISTSLDPETIYTTVHWAAGRLMPVEAFVISLLDEEKQEADGVYLMDLDRRAPRMRLPLDRGLSGRVITSGEPLLLHGTENATQAGGVTVGEKGIPLSVVAVPMVIGGRVLGMLSAQSYQPKVYTEADQQILSTLANQAIIAIQNGRLFAETQRLAEELEQRVVARTAELEQEQRNTETLLRILSEVSSSLDLDRALNRTLSLLNESIGAEQGTIMLLNAEDNLLHYRAGYGYVSEGSKKIDQRESARRTHFTLKVGEGLAGWVVKNRRPALVDDLFLDERWVQSETVASEHRSALAVPLMVADDVIGVMMVFHRQAGFFSSEQLNLVQAIASQVSVAINNANLYELIRDQAERLGNMLRNEQVEASRQQAILEAVADGVLVTDVNNRISFINTSAQNILSLHEEEVTDKSLDTFLGIFGKAGQTWMETIRNWSDNPTGFQQGETYAEQIDLEDGRVVLVHLAPVIFKGNEFLGTVSIFRDITHEVEVDRLKSEFVATVSHELRTPMTSIRGYVDIMLMGAAGALNENQRHFLDIVRNNTERLNILVNDLLDVSRIEAGRISLSMQPIEIHELVREVLAHFEQRAQDEQKTMQFMLNIPQQLPRVYGDLERVRQILNNLVDNAYHYTPEHGQVSVHVHHANGNEKIQIDVRDTGVGIALADQERIFERFYRGEHPLVLATPGTGLGLSIVKQLVVMHQGEMWMASTGMPGEGSVFSFTLPVYSVE